MENEQSAEAQENNATSDSDLANVNAPKEEPMVPQHVLNSFAGQSKKREKEAFEKGRQAALEQLNSSNEKQQTPSYDANLSLDQIRNMIREENEKRVEEERQKYHEREAQNLANRFLAKMESGKSNYDAQEFDQAISELELEKTAAINLVQLTEPLDNTADVMFHFAQNPGTAAEVISAFQVNPRWAHKMVKNISDKIRANQNPSPYFDIKSPIPPVKRSRISNDGSSEPSLSIKDLKMQHLKNRK